MALRACLRALSFSHRVRCLGGSPTFRNRRFSRNHTLQSSKVQLHFVNQNGTKTSVTATAGESLLDIVINKNLQIDGFGACEGTLACSTCHLVFESSVYDQLEPTGDEEMDMLDLAYGLTKTSRLGCQVMVEPWMDGTTVCVPQEIKDQRVPQGKKNQ